MPAREAGYTPMETLPLDERLKHEGPFQEHWYRHVAETFARGRTVCDVGAASGYGLDLLAAAGAVDAFGLDPMPLGPRVRALSVEELPDKSWDLVTAIDVIEHVADDRAFFGHLLRVARWAVFLSTPNWTVCQAVNPYHAREYTADELRALIGDRRHTVWTSDSERVVTHAPAGLTPDIAAPNFGVLIEV